MAVTAKGLRWNRPTFVIDNVRRLRENFYKIPISRRELAKRCGVTEAVMAYMFHAPLETYTPTKDNYNKVADYLHWRRWE